MVNISMGYTSPCPAHGPLAHDPVAAPERQSAAYGPDAGSCHRWHRKCVSS
jgi:hypothetical protein